MRKNQSVTMYVLTSLLVAAGINSANASDTSIDEATANKVISVLVSEQSQRELVQLSHVASIEDLTAAQKEGLLQVIREAADSIRYRHQTYP